MAFEAGRLDVKVTLLRAETGHDGFQQVTVWSAIGTRYASRRPLSGGERGEAEGRRSFGRFSLWLRLDSLTASLLATDGVAMNGQRFELTEPPREVETARRRGMELLVEGTGEAFGS
jgi:head-tail adaptor